MQDYVGSCSKVFRNPKNAEEERNLIEKVNTCSDKVVMKNSLEWQNGRRNKNIEPRAFTTDKFKVQRLDTDTAMTAESLNLWLIKFVVSVSVSCSSLIYNKNPQTNENEVYRYKVTACYVLSTIR